MTASKTKLKVPCAYQEWLACFDEIKHRPRKQSAVIAAMRAGTFSATEATLFAMQRRIAETVNLLLDDSSRRLVKVLNDCAAFHDWEDLTLHLYRFKKEAETVLFFKDLTFLPENFRAELQTEIEKQVRQFWSEATQYLYQQSLENPGSEAEDCLFLIKRIKLF